MSNQINDPYESADNPKVSTLDEFWGKALVDAKFVAFVDDPNKPPKPNGKPAQMMVDFDSSVHAADKRRSAIDISIDTLPDMALRFSTVDRNYLAENKVWAGVVLPTIKDLGISVRELNGRFVKIALVPDGTFYKGTDGLQHESKNILFKKLFADENACRADFLASKSGDPEPAAADPTNNKEKETAAKFLKVIVENAARGQNDIEAIRAKCATAIAGMPLVSKYFTADSIEVINLIAEKVV